MTAKLVRILLLGVAVGALACLSGCIRLNMDLGVRQDLSVKALIRLGVDERMQDAGGTASGGAFDKLRQSEGAANWKTREYKEGNWRFSEATGEVPAHESVFGKDEGAPQLTKLRAEHRLSSRYRIKLVVPASASPAVPGIAPAEPGAGVEGAPDPEAMGMMVENLMAGIQIRFRLSGPGRVVATSGRVIADGTAEWDIKPTEIGGDKTPEMWLVTEIPNWTNVGRLADQLAAKHELYDAGPRLGDAVQRGLLPNPPASTSAEDKLSVVDYYRLLVIIRALDEVLPAADVAKTVQQLKLNAEDVSPAGIKAVYDRLPQGGLAERLAAERARAVLEALGR